MLFSKEWRTRAKGLIDLKAGLGKFNFGETEQEEMQDIFIAIMAAIRIGCADKNAQVNIFAIDLFLTVIRDVYKYFENMESEDHRY